MSAALTATLAQIALNAAEAGDEKATITLIDATALAAADTNLDDAEIESLITRLRDSLAEFRAARPAAYARHAARPHPH